MWQQDKTPTKVAATEQQQTTSGNPGGTTGGRQEGSNLLFTCGFSGDNQTTRWMVGSVCCANSSVIFLSKTCHSVEHNAWLPSKDLNIRTGGDCWQQRLWNSVWNHQTTHHHQNIIKSPPTQFLKCFTIWRFSLYSYTPDTIMIFFVLKARGCYGRWTKAVS